MKKNRTRIQNIVLDLTSLLDVIFIILMVVMCNQHTKFGENTQPPTIVNPAVPPTLEERVVTVSVGISFDEDVVNRHIEMTVNDETPNVINITQSNVELEGDDNPYNRFEKDMKEFVGSNMERDIPVILTLDDREMLYRDAVRVSEILSRLDDEYSNLYCRGLVEWQR